MKTVLGKKLITCIMPHGRALPVLEALKEELGILATSIHHARGTGRMTPLAWRGVGEAAEKDVLSVIVPASRAEEVFGFIYENGRINQPHGGIVYQQTLSKSTEFHLPDLPDEAASKR
ncbi:MAG: hypothetical protein IH968_10530 [Gemmatimonadetes bacterium]|nr:hypothetical protein [Gemmatimonadota bacterium]